MDSFKLRLARAKVEIHKRVGKPTGSVDTRTQSGKTIKYSFYETGDFIDQIDEVLADQHILAFFDLADVIIADEKVPREKAVLTIMDCDSNDSLKLMFPTEDAVMSTRIQALGAKLTYLKRYAYINAFDLAEKDMVEAKEKADNRTVKQKKPTDAQLKALFAKMGEEEVRKLCQGCNVSSSKDLPLNVVEFYLATEVEK